MQKVKTWFIGLKWYWKIVVVIIPLYAIGSLKKAENIANKGSSHSGKRIICDYCGKSMVSGNGEYSLPNSNYSDYRFCSQVCLNQWAKLRGVNINY